MSRTVPGSSHHLILVEMAGKVKIQLCDLLQQYPDKPASTSGFLYPAFYENPVFGSIRHSVGRWWVRPIAIPARTESRQRRVSNAVRVCNMPIGLGKARATIDDANDAPAFIRFGHFTAAKDTRTFEKTPAGLLEQPRGQETGFARDTEAPGSGRQATERLQGVKCRDILRIIHREPSCAFQACSRSASKGACPAPRQLGRRLGNSTCPSCTQVRLRSRVACDETRQPIP